MAQWIWVWVNSGSWWWTGKPGMVQSTGSQRVGHNWATELNWTEVMYLFIWWPDSKESACHVGDLLLANHGFLENCFFELTYRNSWCHIIFSSVQNLLLLYHLFPLLTIARSAGDLPFSPTEPLTTLFHSVLCSWQRLVHMGCNNGFPCPPSSCWVWLLVNFISKNTFMTILTQ